MINLKRYIYVGIGGGIGSMSRFGLLKITQIEIILFPYSTILINLFGAFILTFLINLTCFKIKFPKDFQIAINVGLIGSFTTFSLMMTDIIQLTNLPYLLFIYYLMMIIGGLIASFSAYLFALSLNKKGDLS